MPPIASEPDHSDCEEGGAKLLNLGQETPRGGIQSSDITARSSTKTNHSGNVTATPGYPQPVQRSLEAESPSEFNNMRQSSPVNPQIQSSSHQGPPLGKNAYGSRSSVLPGTAPSRSLDSRNAARNPMVVGFPTGQMSVNSRLHYPSSTGFSHSPGHNQWNDYAFWYKGTPPPPPVQQTFNPPNLQYQTSSLWPQIQPQGAQYPAQVGYAEQIAMYQKTCMLLDQLITNQIAIDQRLQEMNQRMEDGFQSLRDWLDGVKKNEYGEENEDDEEQEEEEEGSTS